jgi:thiol-disulfide isomerase/thioredoxin
MLLNSHATSIAPWFVAVAMVCAASLTAGWWVHSRTLARANPVSASAVEEDGFVQQALRAGKPTVVEFSADNCTACKEMKPVLAQLAREQGSRIGVLDINLLKHGGYISRYRTSPCTLATVPVAIGYVSGQAATPRRSLGLAADRLGLLAGASAGPASVAVGALLIAVAVVLWRNPWGALILGELVGTVMSPCATPALALALTVASTGSAFSASTAWGAALLLVAGAAPGAASAIIGRLATAQRWLSGPRLFAGLLALAGLWWLAQGLGQ